MSEHLDTSGAIGEAIASSRFITFLQNVAFNVGFCGQQR